MEKGTSLYRDLLPLLDQDYPLILGTIVAAEGATPQIPGASALFSERGLLLGTLGGGVLEADAQTRSLRCLREGHSISYRFDLQGEAVEAEEPVCGGSVWVLIDASPADHRRAWRSLDDSLKARRRGLLITRFNQRSGENVGIERFWIEEGTRSERGKGESFDNLALEMAEARRQHEPVFVGNKRIAEGGVASFFIEPIFPLPRLVIVGAGHIGRAVSRLGSWLDFEVTVIDDRPEYASRERFPEAASLVVGEIGRITLSFPVTSDTFVVIVTRGHKHDAEALRAFIRSPAVYVGMIGSRHKIALMRDRFLSEGWATAQEWDRVHTPIGMKIGSRTVEEIAVSIAAELIQARSRARELRSEVNR